MLYEFCRWLIFLCSSYVLSVFLTDEKPKVSVKEGKNVFLITGVKDIQTYDLILNLNGRTIAKIDKNYQSRNNSSYSRLLLDSLSGSLIMSDSATTDTGDYDLTMSSSTYSLQRTISVTVSSEYIKSLFYQYSVSYSRLTRSTLFTEECWVVSIH